MSPLFFLRYRFAILRVCQESEFLWPFLLRLQVLVSRNQTLPQSASGGLILWPTSGTRSRQSVRSAQHFRLWPCSSFLRYLWHKHCLPLGCALIADVFTVWCWGSGVLQLRIKWTSVDSRAFSTGVHASVQYDPALWSGIHIVALYRNFAGTPSSHRQF